MQHTNLELRADLTPEAAQEHPPIEIAASAAEDLDDQYLIPATQPSAVIDDFSDSVALSSLHKRSQLKAANVPRRPISQFSLCPSSPKGFGGLPSSLQALRSAAVCQSLKNRILQSANAEQDVQTQLSRVTKTSGGTQVENQGLLSDQSSDNGTVLIRQDDCESQARSLADSSVAQEKYYKAVTKVVDDADSQRSSNIIRLEEESSAADSQFNLESLVPGLSSISVGLAFAMQNVDSLLELKKRILEYTRKPDAIGEENAAIQSLLLKFRLAMVESDMRKAAIIDEQAKLLQQAAEQGFCPASDAIERETMSNDDFSEVIVLDQGLSRHGALTIGEQRNTMGSIEQNRPSDPQKFKVASPRSYFKQEVVLLNISEHSEEDQHPSPPAVPFSVKNELLKKQEKIEVFDMEDDLNLKENLHFTQGDEEDEPKESPSKARLAWHRKKRSECIGGPISEFASKPRGGLPPLPKKGPFHFKFTATEESEDPLDNSEDITTDHMFDKALPNLKPVSEIKELPEEDIVSPAVSQGKHTPQPHGVTEQSSSESPVIAFIAGPTTQRLEDEEAENISESQFDDFQSLVASEETQPLRNTLTEVVASKKNWMRHLNSRAQSIDLGSDAQSFYTVKQME